MLRHIASNDHRSHGALTLGGAQLGNLGRAITDDQARQTVDAAWDAGIRAFDTAPHYGLGLSERRLGDALAGRPRDEYTVSTKAGRLLIPSPETAHTQDEGGFAVPASWQREWDFSRDGIRRSLESSLDRLTLDRVDILYLHDPDGHEEDVIREGLPALIELREEGLVRAVGVGMNQSAMPARFLERFDLDIVMLAGRYTLLDQGALDDLLPLAAERDVAVIIAGVYNSGLLARDRVPADAMYDYAPAPAELIARANRVAAVCEHFGTTLPTAALHFALRHYAVRSVAIGCHDVAQLVQNLTRWQSTVPDGLWSALAREGLIRGEEHS